MVIVSVKVFKTKFSIQINLRQFLFEVNWTKTRGEILKKLCVGHHASTHNSEKSCLSSISPPYAVKNFFEVQTNALQKVVGFEYVKNAGAIFPFISTFT